MDLIKVFPSHQVLAQAVAQDIATCAQDAIAQRGRFAIALSGGSTPVPLFDALASPPFRDRIAWDRVHVFWCDERTVPPDHPDSNYGQARARLLDRVPIPVANVHRMQGELDPHAAADAYDRLLHDFFGAAAPGEPQPRFDYVHLGIGADGHTASLFPSTEALAAADPERWVVANFVPRLHTWRITLTAAAINAGRQVVFMVEGAEKAQTLAAVVQGPPRPDDLPAQLIAPVAGRLMWMVDEAAAGQLALD